MRAEVVCVSGVDLLMEYLEGALTAGQVADIEAHVAACPRCAAFIASYRATPPILRRATLVGVPENLAESLLAFLRSRRG